MMFVPVNEVKRRISKKMLNLDRLYSFMCFQIVMYIFPTEYSGLEDFYEYLWKIFNFMKNLCIFECLGCVYAIVFKAV